MEIKPPIDPQPIPYEIAKPKVLAIDVDGFLTNETCWTAEEMKSATPRPETVEFVREKFCNSLIIIYTARREEFREITRKWLIANDIPFHLIEMGKLPCDEYWDDHAFNLEDING